MGEGRMTVQVNAGGEHATTHGVEHRPQGGVLSVPYADSSVIQSIATGFRQHMFSLSDDDGKALGEVDTGAGWGNDFITLRWGDKIAHVRGLDLLRCWVQTFDPKAAARFPGGLTRGEDTYDG